MCVCVCIPDADVDADADGNDLPCWTICPRTHTQADFDNSLEVWRTVEVLQVRKTPILYAAMLNCIARSQRTETLKTDKHGELSHGRRIRVWGGEFEGENQYLKIQLKWL